MLDGCIAPVLDIYNIAPVVCNMVPDSSRVEVDDDGPGVAGCSDIEAQIQNDINDKDMKEYGVKCIRRFTTVRWGYAMDKLATAAMRGNEAALQSLVDRLGQSGLCKAQRRAMRRRDRRHTTRAAATR